VRIIAKGSQTTQRLGLDFKRAVLEYESTDSLRWRNFFPLD